MEREKQRGRFTQELLRRLKKMGFCKIYIDEKGERGIEKGPGWGMVPRTQGEMS